MEFSRQEYWSRLPCPPLGDLPNPGIGPMSLTPPALRADSLRLAPPGEPSYSILHTQVNSKRITDLNIKAKYIKTLGENKGESHLDFGVGKDFLD